MTGYLIFQSIFIQALATAILVFLYLTQTEEKTKLSDDNAITTLIIAGAYYVGVYWSSSFDTVQTSNPLNPAIAMGDGLGMLLHAVFYWDTWIWIFYIVPLGGSLIAVLLFEYVYKPAQETVQEEQPDTRLEQVSNYQYMDRDFRLISRICYVSCFNTSHMSSIPVAPPPPITPISVRQLMKLRIESFIYLSYYLILFC